MRRNGKRVYTVTGVGRGAANLAIAKRRGAIDSASTNLRASLRQADIVFLCVPVHHIAPLVRKNLSAFKPGAIITDVGGVKGPVVTGIKAALSKRKDLNFVGAHPIAGSEKTGAANADAKLFRRAVCVITKDHASFRAMDAVRSAWTAVGARCLLMSATEHDQWLALTSHLPHMLAFALFSEVNDASMTAPVKELVAGSFRDMTRIAGSDPDVWTGIITSNRAALKKTVVSLVKRITALSNASPTHLRKTLTRLARAKTNW